ncbi:MAG: phosphoribosylglycinamide formyltransferase [Candidatus Marinimicrobia bacterium]|nr:phosphoribosylglycinamide formyltransferase [Candidatus Neomarinimicrobiota bacterium]
MGQKSTKLKSIAVFASGRGSNFAAILEQIQRGNIPAQIRCIISDHTHPPVFDIAGKAGISTHWVNRKQFDSRDDYTIFLLSLLEKYKVDLVVLAGYLKLIPMPIVKRYKNSMINIHPALLPNFCGKGFYGIKVHEAVIESGVKITGVTVHFVDEHYDTGPIIIQEKVEVLPDDIPETLAKRVLKIEHKVYPEVVKAFCDGRLEVVDRKVLWRE